VLSNWCFGCVDRFVAGDILMLHRQTAQTAAKEACLSTPSLSQRVARRFDSERPMHDYDDPAVEAQWCAECQAQVTAYLQREGVEHGRVGEWPAWHVAPHVSIWAIESKKRPDWIGWWAISGDLPTDYISAAKIKHPRDAVRAIAEEWRELAKLMASGQRHPHLRIGQPEDGTLLGPLLERRAVMLLEWANDDSLWEDVDRR
jgi:hypothetical protein